MHATTKPEDKELLTKLRKLISTNEKIKKAEAEFRLSCKVEKREITKFRLTKMFAWLQVSCIKRNVANQNAFL